MLPSKYCYRVIVTHSSKQENIWKFFPYPIDRQMIEGRGKADQVDGGSVFSSWSRSNKARHCTHTTHDVRGRAPLSLPLSRYHLVPPSHAGLRYDTRRTLRRNGAKREAGERRSPRKTSVAQRWLYWRASVSLSLRFHLWSSAGQRRNSPSRFLATSRTNILERGERASELRRWQKHETQVLLRTSPGVEGYLCREKYLLNDFFTC